MTAAGTGSRRAVTMAVESDGAVAVTVDGLRLLPATGAWRRESYAQVIDHATANRVVAAMVEVREADGSVFREFVPTARGPRIPVRVVEAAAAGFLPGEQVAIAPVALHLLAAADGTVSCRIPLPTDSAVLAEPVEVLLLGRTSGTIHLTEPA